MVDEDDPILGDHPSVMSEDWVLERVASGALGIQFRLIDTGALPPAEYRLILGVEPTRTELARAIGAHARSYIADDLARKAPDEWVVTEHGS